MFILKEVLLFLIGGSVYQGIEILWRGYTHFSMFLAGGFGLLAVDMINMTVGSRSLMLTVILSGAAITVVELIAGLIVNVRLGLGVWDYSLLPLNFKGQICLLYSLFWTVLSVPAVIVCRAAGRLTLWLSTHI